MKLLMLGMSLFIVLLNFGCASLSAQAEAAKQCGNDNYYAKEPTLEQLKCMEEKGKNIPNYQSVQAKINSIEESERLEFNENLAKCVFTTLRLKSPIGGVLRYPGEIRENVIKEKLTRFCKEKNLDSYEVEEVSQKKDFLGTSGISSASCNGSACFGGSSSEAQYEYYVELKFQCI